MDASVLLTLTQTLLQLIGVVQKTESVWSFKSQLGKLKNTMTAIHAVLEVAEKLETQQLGITNEADRNWMGRLRVVVYQAENLFDEVAYVAQLEELMSGNKVIKEVQLFFSRFNHLNVSREIMKIRESLDDIAKDRRDFGSQLLPHGSAEFGMSRRSRITEMRSLVHVNDVIGRDVDKKVVIDMLLDSSIQEDVRFVTIVGIGGLGKTTLAKLVFDEDSIQREFPMKLWVCVSEEFDLRAILCQLLRLPTNQGQLGMHELEQKFRGKIQGNKYLLVLDDVWNEDRNRWLQLKGLLIRGARGSRVVVTTRSGVVAQVVGGSSVHQLKGLSPQDSWSLFKRMAFEDEAVEIDTELIELGEHIVKKCFNVPLAIRVVGSLLFRQDKSTWKSFTDMDLASIQQGNNNDIIIPILNLSYYNLEPQLRRCFSYCAVFPKDHVIDKEMLIHLWMAHGFIQSIEDVGEKCFRELLQRCFFQDCLDDDIVSCMMWLKKWLEQR